MPHVQIPNNWTPRAHQLPALQKFEEGYRRQFHVWHRRAGKDSFCLNLGAIQAHREVGTYWHLFPLQNQARKAIWHGIDREGHRIIDRTFPEAVCARRLDNEMLIDLAVGSTWQMAGSDRYDTLVGSNVKGVVFSEWALCDPAAWDYIRPIIRENDGWAVFITTFRGKNHAWRDYQRYAALTSTWFCSMYDVTQTYREDGRRIITDEDLQAERDEGMSESMVQQEYFNSPMAAFEGAYWSDEMLAMQRDKRITTVRYESHLPVLAAFDLGMDDEMACIYLQETGNETRCIGADTWRRTGIPKVAEDMRAHGWPISTLILPPDARVQEMGSGLVREEVFRSLFPSSLIDIVPTPPGSLMDSISQVRDFLSRVWIHHELHKLIDALSGYRTEQKQATTSTEPVFQLQPAHTWESHLASAMRYYVMHRNSRASLPNSRTRDPNEFQKRRKVI